MAEREIQNVTMNFASTGIVTKAGSESLPDGAWAALLNMQTEEEGVLSSRRGMALEIPPLGTTLDDTSPTAPYPIHSIYEFLAANNHQFVYVTDRSGKIWEYDADGGTGGFPTTYCTGSEIVGKTFPGYPEGYNGVGPTKQVTYTDYLSYMDPRETTATFFTQGTKLNFCIAVADGWRFGYLDGTGEFKKLGMPRPKSGIAGYVTHKPKAVDLPWMQDYADWEAPGAGVISDYCGCNSFVAASDDTSSKHKYVAVSYVYQSDPNVVKADYVESQATYPFPLWVKGGQVAKIWKWAKDYPGSMVASDCGDPGYIGGGDEWCSTGDCSTDGPSYNTTWYGSRCGYSWSPPHGGSSSQTICTSSNPPAGATGVAQLAMATGVLRSVVISYTSDAKTQEEALGPAVRYFENTVKSPLISDAIWVWSSGLRPVSGEKNYTDGWTGDSWGGDGHTDWINSEDKMQFNVPSEIDHAELITYRSSPHDGTVVVGGAVKLYDRLDPSTAFAEAGPGQGNTVAANWMNSGDDYSYTPIGIGACRAGSGMWFGYGTLVKLSLVYRKECPIQNQALAFPPPDGASSSTPIGWRAYCGLTQAGMKNVLTGCNDEGYIPWTSSAYVTEPSEGFEYGSISPTFSNSLLQSGITNGNPGTTATLSSTAMAGVSTVSGYMFYRFKTGIAATDALYGLNQANRSIGPQKLGTTEETEYFTFPVTINSGSFYGGTIRFYWNDGPFQSVTDIMTSSTYYESTWNGGKVTKATLYPNVVNAKDMWKKIWGVGIFFTAAVGTSITMPKGTFYTTGMLSGEDINYAYTFYDRNSGVESPCWVKMDNMVVADKENVTILFNQHNTGATMFEPTADATDIRIYRMGGGLDTFYLVDQIPLDQNMPTPYPDAVTAEDEGDYAVGPDAAGNRPNAITTTGYSDASLDPFGPAWSETPQPTPAGWTPRKALQNATADITVNGQGFWYTDRKSNGDLVSAPELDLEAGAPVECARGCVSWENRLWTWGGYEMVDNYTGNSVATVIEPVNRIRWSNVDAAWNFNPSSYMYVGETNDEIVRLIVWEGELFACTANTIFRIVSLGGGNYQAQTTSSNVSPIGRMAICLSAKIALVRCYDGIYTFPNGQKLTEELNQLFLGDGQAGLSPVQKLGTDMTKQMPWAYDSFESYDGRIFWSYRSTQAPTGEQFLNDGWWNDTTVVFDYNNSRTESLRPVGVDCMLMSQHRSKLLAGNVRQSYPYVNIAGYYFDSGNERRAMRGVMSLEQGWTDTWDAGEGGIMGVHSWVISKDMDFGAPDNEKQVIDIEADVDSNGQVIKPFLRPDGSESDPFGNTVGNQWYEVTNFTPSNVRTHNHFQLEGLTNLQAKSLDSDALIAVRRIASGFTFANSATATRPIRLYGGAIRLLSEPIWHRSFRTGWEHGGQPGDKFWTNFWVEYNDLGVTPTSFVVTIRQSDGDEQTFTITTGLATNSKRNRKYFPIGVDIAGELALLKINTTGEIKVYDYGWVTQPKSTAMQVAQTEWTDCGYPHRKMFKHVDLDLNTQGRDVTINIWVDGVVIDTFVATTPAGEAGRRQILHSLPEETFGKLIRFTTDDPDGVEIYAQPNWEYDMRNPDVTLADAYEQTLNYNGKKVLRKMFYCVENPNSVVTLDIFVDNVLRFTATIPDNGPSNPADYVHPNQGGSYAPDGVHPAWGPYPKFGIRRMDFPPYLKGKVFRFRFRSDKAFEIDLVKTEIYTNDLNQGFPLRTPELPPPNNA